MNKSYSLIVFDWEGTIAEDALGQVIQTIAQEAKRMHAGEFDKSLARQYIGLGMSSAIKLLFPQLYLYQQEQLSAAVQTSYTKSLAEIMLVDGAKDTILRLHAAGYKLAVATNKGQASLQRALQSTGLDAYFPVTRSASQVPPKPCPQMLEEIMSDIDVSSAKTLMIGDSLADIQMARAIGVDVVGVDFYQTQREELLAEGAIEVLDTYQQVNAYLHLSGG